MKNIHMMLPPTYRDLWKGEFAQWKKADVDQGNGWLYEADPFYALKERQDAQAAAEKRKAEAERKKAEELKQPGFAGFDSNGSSNGSRQNAMRGWTKIPKIEMGIRQRRDVEGLIKKRDLWNPHGVQIPASKLSTLVEEIVKLGFRKSHVEEAAAICKDREEILEWLLVHVPEDDLPPWSLPEGYTAGISMASGDLKREGIIKRLAAAGYSKDLCEEILKKYNGEEAQAAAALQARLLQQSEADELGAGISATSLNDGADIWDEEQDTLAAIYDERCERVTPETSQILLELPPEIREQVFLHIRKPCGTYPQTLPIISIHAKLPAYIRLSITRHALLHAKESLIGEQMVFSLIDWLEQNIPRIVDNPGKLSDVASAGAGTAEDETQLQANRRPRNKQHPRPIQWQARSPRSMQALEDLQKRASTPAQQRMLKARQNLPAWKLQDSIVAAVEAHKVTIISGETGSGKSTQSVQFILDDLIRRHLGEAVNIICTQPRRISALGLADRVADERCSVVGEEVGYIIRGESKQKKGLTKITFVTTGVLLRRLQTSGGRAEDVVASLADVSHVVVDEVHERSLDTDFLLALLRDVLKVRHDLKVILMSATLDADVFERYFSIIGPVGRVEIQGRTHPVQDIYLEDVIRMIGFNGHTEEDISDEEQATKAMAGALRGVGTRINYDLVAQLVQCIDDELGDQDGGILIFLPGTMEIDRTIQALRQFPHIHALPLHASLLPAEQRRVFPLAPKGRRKVIASTNVAETSITIEDIVAVIDTGRVKETSFDPASSMVKLQEVWASRAACKQRRGRAGRVRAGKCYKLYTHNLELTKMAERPDPEIRRVPLEQLCLSVKAMGVSDVPSFLAATLTPPETVAVDKALELLRRMNALDGELLTSLGRHMSSIPADLRCSKLLIYGVTFGCLDACLTIASILTARSPFVSPQGKRDDAKYIRTTFGKGQGDLLCDMRAYEQFGAMRSKGVATRDIRRWCDDNFLSWQTLNDIASNRSQYLSSLKESGFLPTSYSTYDQATYQSYNRHNENDALIRALVAGAFNPQLARIEFPETRYVASSTGAVALDPEARTIKYFTQESGRVFVHPSSTLFDAQGFVGGSAFVSFFTKMETSKIFIRDITRKFNRPNLYNVEIVLTGPTSFQPIYCAALLWAYCSRHPRSRACGRRLDPSQGMGAHRCSYFSSSYSS